MALRVPVRKIGRFLFSDVRGIERNCGAYFLNSAKGIYVRALQTSQVNCVKTLESAKVKNFRDEKTVYIAQNDPDIFGQTPFESEEGTEDPGDIEEENYIRNPPNTSKRLPLVGYARLIKEHLNNNRIKEAIDVLEVRMLKEDRVKPSKYIYNLLISGCAKAGYSRKAFQLYNKMKQRALPVTAGTYTSLFNACANCPWPQDGIEKANRLREIMLEKGYIPNSKNYNAMIKAYGRCGDIQTAFQLADEMMERDLPITAETFNFLLQACASDQELGFRHALVTWHKMLKRKIVPDLYSFNTMLRCIRDCSMGDVETMKELVLQIIGESQDNIKLLSSETNTKLSNPTENIAPQNESPSEICENSSTVELLDPNTNNEIKEICSVPAPVNLDTTPNLLCNTPHLGSLISIGEIKAPEDKLLLLGGFSGFLYEMKKAKVTPGIETFTAFLEVIPSTRTAEKQLISAIRKIGLKADIDFFNVLIKKRSMRFDYDGAKEVLSMIKTAKLHPDIVTYGVLALSCQTQEDARELLQEMNQKGIRMNIQILGAMLRQGCAHNNFPYVHEIMQITLEEKIKPNEEFLKHLDNFNKRCMKLIANRHPATKSKTFKHNFDNFKKKLKIWYEEFGIENLKLEDAVKKLKEHPFQQYKEGQEGGLEETKNEKLRRKEKIKKYIKRIKVQTLKGDE